MLQIKLKKAAKKKAAAKVLEKLPQNTYFKKKNQKNAW